MLTEPTIEKLYKLRLGAMAVAWTTQREDPKMNDVDFDGQAVPGLGNRHILGTYAQFQIRKVFQADWLTRKFQRVAAGKFKYESVSLVLRARHANEVHRWLT